MDKCPSCDGFGVIFPAPWEKIDPLHCEVCDGEGYISDKKKVWVEQGRRLKKYRLEELEETLRSVAKEYGFDPAYISRMERGIVKPRPPRELYKK